MSYQEMCFAAERTGAIPCFKDFLFGESEIFVFRKNADGKINWSKKKSPRSMINNKIASGQWARAWSDPELWAMLDYGEVRKFGPDGFSFAYDDEDALITRTGPLLESSRAALLWGVMAKRGYLWNATTKNFERRA